MEGNDDAGAEPACWEKKLWLACETLQVGVSAAQEAIRNNANVNWENPEDMNYTPLHRAVIFCNKEVVELLLSNGANPNSVNKNKQTPLTTAAKVGNKEIVKLLLDNGANIEATACDEQFTALHLAAEYSNVGVVKLLVKRGARVDPKTTAGKTPLDLSVEANKPATVDYLRKAIESRGATIVKSCMQELWEACHAGDVVKAKELLTSELNLDWINPTFHMYTPFNIATMYGHKQIVTLLFDAGANPSKASENGDIPLVTAASAGFEEIVEYLLDTCHVDIDSIDGCSNTALHKAAKHAHMNVVELLVTKGANVNLRNKEGNTPLHLSSKEGHPMVSEYLLGHNANQTIKNKENKTALKLALEENNSISVKLISKKSKEAELWKACKNGNLAEVKKMMLQGAEVHWNNPACKDYTSLHIATVYEHAKVVKELLKNGDADPNYPNPNGFSPLITAANNGDLLIFKHLLKSNASINFQGNHKDTALHRAAKHSYREMVKILIDKNAELDLLNEDGNTPLHMAAMEGHAVIVRYLVQNGANVSITNNSRNTAEDLARTADHQCVLFELKDASTNGKQDKVRQTKFQTKFRTSDDLYSVTYKYESKLTELQSENELLQAKFDKLRASHQLVQADFDVERELQAKLIEAVQSSRPTHFLIMQLQHKLLTQQATSSLLSVSHQRGSEILNAIKPWSVATVETSVQTNCHDVADLKIENEMLQAKVHKLRASHQLDLNVEKELLAKLIQAVQSSRPTHFLIMQLEDKLLTQQATSSLPSVSNQRGLDIVNAIKPWSGATVETSVQTSSHDVAKDFLCGVEAYGETMLEVVGAKQQKLEWPGYGFYIEVPDGALLHGVTAHVVVKVILAGQVELPEKSQLISAFYWVSSSEVFLKEVAVNIQHCAVITSEEQCSEFKFIVVRCSQDVLPYKFKKKDGLFNMHTQYAAIKVKRFLFFGLTSPWSTELHYMSLKFYKPITNTNKVNYVFVLVPNHELYVKAVRQEYADFTEDKQMQAVDFERAEVVLNLSFPDPKTVDGWKIQLLTSPKFTKADVKQFQPGRRLLVPACTIELEWIGEGQQQQLFHKVTILGAKEPNFFNMRYYPDSAGHGMSTGATGVTPSPHHQSSTVTAPFSPQQLLSAVAHLSNDEIETILREKYVELQGAMCVNPADMARKLYARGFITEHTLRMVTFNHATATDGAKADALMEGSQTFILSHESSAEMLAEFLGIMNKVGGTAHNVAESLVQCVIQGKGDKTRKVSQPIDSLAALESPLPSASSTSSRTSATQHQSMDSRQENVFEKSDTPIVDYTCPVCTEILTQQFLTDCGHHVCGTCRDQLVTTGRADCPVCHKTSELRNACLNKQLQHEVNSLEVCCEHQDKGCEWVGEVKDLQNHLDPEKGKCSYAFRVTEHTQQTTLEKNVESMAENAEKDPTIYMDRSVLKPEGREKQHATNTKRMCSTIGGRWVLLLSALIMLYAVLYYYYSVNHSVAPGSLPRMQVYGETVLIVVGNKPQRLKWPGYGFYIDVPEGALSSGVTANVTVKVIFGDRFKPPENSQLISAIYWVSSSTEFLKEVSVNIQHCAVITSEEQLSDFKFIIAKSFQKVPPYHFKEREGLFSTHTQYGTIKLKQFSEISAIGPSNVETLFTGLMYYKENIQTNSLSVDFRFVVVNNLEAYLQGVNMKYQEWMLDDYNLDIRFEDEAVVINQQEQEIDSWRIFPLSSPPQVAKDAVSKFQVGRRIPHCAFELQQLLGRSLQQQPLRHKVELTGVTSPRDFYIRYPQPESNRVKKYAQPTPLADSLDSQQKILLESAVVTVVVLVLSFVACSMFCPWSNFTYHTRAATKSTQKVTASSSSQRTSEDDPLTKTPKKSDLLNRVASQALNKWERMGLQLDLEQHQLDAIQSQDPIKCYSVVFDLWKKKTDPPFTWATVLEALRAPIVGENDLAEKIDKWLRK